MGNLFLGLKKFCEEKIIVLNEFWVKILDQNFLFSKQDRKMLPKPSFEFQSRSCHKIQDKCCGNIEPVKLSLKFGQNQMSNN